MNKPIIRNELRASKFSFEKLQKIDVLSRRTDIFILVWGIPTMASPITHISRRNALAITFTFEFVLSLYMKQNNLLNKYIRIN